MAKVNAFFFNNWLILTLAFSTFLVSSCKEDDDEPSPKTTLTLVLSESNNDVSIIYDSINYVNAIGNRYSINRLQYYVSDFRFHQQGGPWIHIPVVVYRDGKNPMVDVEFDDLPLVSFDSIQFTFGLNETDNVSGGLAANTDNLNMAWPEPMGGGYHFLKMEGHFINTESKVTGYALHVGTNITRDPIKDEVFFDMTADRILTIDMDADNWFQDPNLVDLNNVNYTMGNDTMMRKVIQNGKNVFKMVVR